MIRIINVLYFAVILMIGANAAAAKRCANIFTHFKVTAPIQKSIDSSILALAELKLNLDQKQARGENSIEFTALSANYKEKEQELLYLLETHQIMDAAELTKKIKSEILNLQATEHERATNKDLEEQTIKKQTTRLKRAVINGTHAVFHPIRPGKFKMGDKQIPVHITKPFEMMATVTTQTIWKKVSALAAKHLPKKFHTNPDVSTYEGETRPVESATFNEVQVWIESLNRLSKMKGDLLADIFVGHKKGDIYRLPTEAEWEFVARARGEFDGEVFYIKSKVPEDFEPYAWFNNQKNQPTEPVALKLPLIIDGKEFYDMFGNVFAMTSDIYIIGNPLGGVDPQVLPRRPEDLRGAIEQYSRRGMSMAHSYLHLNLSNRQSFDPTMPDPRTGFRLVREVQP